MKRRTPSPLLRGLLLAGVLLGPLMLAGGARAQSEREVRAVQARMRHEPTVAETVAESLRYFRVDPEAFDDLRAAAKNRAWLPLLATGYRFDDDTLARFENIEVTQPQRINEDTDRKINSVSIGTVWDLRELVFNPAEVQVFGLIGVQRDLMLEVTRTYYLRRQLVLRLALRAPEDALARAALQLRIDEFTAILDVLTGGWFSEEAEGRARRARRGTRRR